MATCRSARNFLGAKRVFRYSKGHSINPKETQNLKDSTHTPYANDDNFLQIPATRL